VKGISFEPIWFDSLGAKSSSTLVKTPDISILIDPGIAVMQPSFPATWAKKIYWEELGRRAIERASKKADVIVISHYHYDHYMPENLDIYKGKLLLAKNPNEYINDSQRVRAERFFDRICRRFGKDDLGKIVIREKAKKYENPMSSLLIARKRDFGSYNSRRSYLLKLGEKWFSRRVEKWNKYTKIPELEFKDIEVKYPESKTFEFGKTKIRFTHAMFHGLEFSRVGWVFATVIERGEEKMIHSSDLDGPVIEDYAEWIIKENPDVLILDGPATYMFGYLLNRINLNRAIENACRIVRLVDSEVIIYDHHLLREAKFKERTKPVWDIAKKEGKTLTTAAEFLGKKLLF
jgi:hypothetical protein